MTELKPHAAHWGSFTAVVQDGRLIAVRPFARDPFPASLIEAIPDIVYAPCRIDRPYIRRGWLEGRRRGTLRGGDPFVPLSWDRAIRLVAEEVARVRDQHGPAAIFGGSYGWASAGRFHHARSQLHRFLSLAGGFTGQLHAYSYAAAQALLPHILGTQEVLLGRCTDWEAIIRHAKVMLCVGGLPLRNAAVASGGAGEHATEKHLRRAVAAGLRFLSVSPYRGDIPEWCNAEWISLRPGTDTALLLALAYVIVSAGWEDRAFLATHCTGWPRLRAYILGETDGIPKTPAWAAAISGVAAERIAAVARDLAHNPAMLTATWSLQRADYGEQPYWMMIALAAILGLIGKPGQGVAFGLGSINGMGNPRHDLPSLSLPALPNPAASFIPVARLTDMLERPGGTYQFNGREYRYPDARLLWWAGGNPFHHHQDLNRLLRAWARAETIIVQEQHWNALARHADIVLPATTTLERNDIACSGRDRYLLAMHQAIAPLGQARNDYDIFADLAEELGFRDRFTEQRDEQAWLRHLYEQWRQACFARGVEPPDFDRFWAEGYWEAPPPAAAEAYTQFAAFRADPQAHPLTTPSGRIELFSETIARFGYADAPGHPVWIPPREWLGAPAAQRYPLHLLSVQPATRLHGQLDPGRVAAAGKIAGREAITLNPADAEARGLKAGDIVRVYNDRGACLAGLRLDPELRQGVALMATGAWFDPLEPGRPGSLCVHGNPNVLTADIGTSRLGQGPSAHSCLVEVEKWTAALPPLRAHLPPPIAAAEP